MSLTLPSAKAFQVAQSKLPKLATQLSIVHCSDPNGNRYHHQAQITWYKDRFFCMWIENLWREDLPGQKAGYATSKDGLCWGAPGILAPMAERGYEMNTRESSGLWNRGDDLFALCGQYRQEPGSVLDYLECKSDIYAWDGTEWQHSGVQIDDYLGFEPPRLLSTGEYVLTGHDQQARIVMLFGGQGSLSEWRRVEIPPPEDKHFLLEPNCWEDTDGTIHVLLRDDNSSHRLYYTASTDGGQTFPAPVKTDIPDARSRISTGVLSDGRLFLCGNSGLIADGTGKPVEGIGFAKRIPLTLALGTVDGTIEKVYSVRADETIGRWAASVPSNGQGGCWGYQYPNVCEHDGFLYIAYSVNKEDIAVSRVALADV
jgi:hypothetical protein